ncbi:hypothetical protein AgCh_031104 [Apium graveolens]
MKEVTFKNVKCKTGGMIPRKGDARIACLALTNDDKFLATASIKGTLVRVYNTLDGLLLQEVCFSATTNADHKLTLKQQLNNTKAKIHLTGKRSLLRVLQVLREGKCTQSDVPWWLINGTMVYVRQIIVSDSSVALPSSYYRHKVIDYKTQQHKLFPLLASTYAFRFAGQLLSWLYKDVIDKLQANDFSTLPEAHACTAGLKSLTTSATTLDTFMVDRLCDQDLFMIRFIDKLKEPIPRKGPEATGALLKSGKMQKNKGVP